MTPWTVLTGFAVIVAMVLFFATAGALGRVVGYDMAHCRRSCPKQGLFRPHTFALLASFVVVVAGGGLSPDIGHG
jgi:hypothetical protein